MPTDARPPLLVVTWFYRHQPGLSIYVARLKALARHARITLICRSPDDARRLGLSDLPVHVIDTPGEGHLDIASYCFKVTRLIRAQARPVPMPVMLLSSHLSMCALRLRGHAVAIYWNEMPSHYFWHVRFNKIKGIVPTLLRWLTYRGARRADLVMPISPFMQQDLLDHGCRADATPVIPMGVYGQALQSGAPTARLADLASQGRLELVYAGTLTDERGKEELLSGVLIALKNGTAVRLTLVGITAAQQAEIAARFGEAGQARSLRLYGVVPHDEAMRIVRDSDVGVTLLQPQPHFQFNPPIKIFELLANGVPTIYNDIRTLSSYLVDRQTGIRAELNGEGVARAIAWCAAHPEAVQAMREHCRRAGEPYLWEKIEPLFLAHLRRIHMLPAEVVSHAGAAERQVVSSDS